MSMNWRTVVISGLIVLSVGLQSATACPYCETETGQQVRAGIFNDQFWSNVTLTLLPLFVLLGIVALIYFDLSWLWPKPHGEGNSPAPRLPQGD
jgi:hypothetical protein